LDKEDTTKVTHLNELAYGFRNSFPDSTIIYSEKSIALCKLILSKKNAKLWTGYSNALGNLGIGYRLKGDYPNAQKYYFEALKIDKQLQYKFGIGKRLVGISNLFLNIGNLPQALTYSYKALEVNLEINNTRAIALSYAIIGNVNNELGNHMQALDYQFKSLKTFIDIKDYNNIVSTFIQLGKIYKEIKKYTESIKYLNQALKLASEKELIQEKAETLNELSAVYFDKGDKKQALNYSLEALKINSLHKINGGIAISCYYYGSCLLEFDSLIKAETYLLKSLEINLENKAIVNQALVYNKLFKLYQMQKQFKKALDFHVLHSLLMDSVNSKTNSQKILIIEYEKSKAESLVVQNANKLVAAQEIEKQKSLNFSIYPLVIFNLEKFSKVILGLIILHCSVLKVRTDLFVPY
jgi:tetratricopeptide (TPR) repeat protein